MRHILEKNSYNFLENMKVLYFQQSQVIGKDLKKVVRYIVLCICFIIVLCQLSEFFIKLYQPPVATHSRYDLNETLTMPAITICREPAYKEDILRKYKLTSHPKYIINWRHFPFDYVNLLEVFKEATYNINETFVRHELNNDESLVEITSNIHFMLGQCYTVYPLESTKNYCKDGGYLLALQHSEPSTTDFEIANGWHVFIHQTKENFSEISMKASGRIEYIFAEVDEEIEIKLQTQEFDMMADKNTCSQLIDYSMSECSEAKVWNEVTKNTNCSGPWMQGIDLPSCKNYSTMSQLIFDYVRIYEGETKLSNKCLDPCTYTIYSAFVQNRKYYKKSLGYTTLWIYYTSKLVSVIEERPGYDLSQFIADIGGSLGFLLGLSVLSIIEILEKIFVAIYSRTYVNLKKDNMEENTNHIHGNQTIIELKEIHK